MASIWTQSIVTSAVALAAVGAAQASVITFEDALAAPQLWSNDAVVQQGFEFVAQDYFHRPRLLGAIADNSGCAPLICPANNGTMYYTSLNDGILRMRLDGGGTFSVNSFDASFLGATGEVLPGAAGLLHVVYSRADGSDITMQYALRSLNSGAVGFETFLAASGAKVGGTGDFGGEFTQAFFYSFACTVGGRCSAFTTGKGQFALDNIDVDFAGVVPEPAQGVLMGLALLAAGAATRRRKPAA